MGDIYKIYERKMQEIVEHQGNAPGIAHEKADQLLVNLLEDVSMAEANTVLDLYDRVEKYYA